MSRPGNRLIGLAERGAAPSAGDPAGGRSALRCYEAAITGGGGSPVWIPLGLEESDLRRVFEGLSGLMLPGGADLDPAAYGEGPRPELGPTDTVLDATELALARWAVESGLPLLAICRGMQVLNVALGGTLYQDIRSQWPDALEHDRFRWRGYPPDDRAHEVAVELSSRLAAALDSHEVMTNSRHHQAIKALAPQLVAVAHTADGLVEGVEIPGARFALGVQWHPENLTELRPMRRLFLEFVGAASATR